jgi:hypothetical protein
MADTSTLSAFESGTGKPSEEELWKLLDTWNIKLPEGQPVPSQQTAATFSAAIANLFMKRFCDFELSDETNQRFSLRRIAWAVKMDDSAIYAAQQMSFLGNNYLVIYMIPQASDDSSSVPIKARLADIPLPSLITRTLWESFSRELDRTFQNLGVNETFTVTMTTPDPAFLISPLKASPTPHQSSAPSSAPISSADPSEAGPPMPAVVSDSPTEEESSTTISENIISTDVKVADPAATDQEPDLPKNPVPTPPIPEPLQEQ